MFKLGVVSICRWYKSAGRSSSRAHYDLPLIRSKPSNPIMYKLLSLFVLVVLAVCVFGEEVQDQEAAEQFFVRYGYYPSWYTAPVVHSPFVYRGAFPYYGYGFPYHFGYRYGF